ncbi:MAG: dienelactone hydrolase family protein [Myxococcales bacterium]|nr:dienelactone hydrolase family protein [Myxococcales bacterium]MDD9965746.1 dienelactone hydrolase family protein [Myxococcales bacterium]
MSEEAIEIRTSDGTADGYLYRPTGDAQAPAVVVLTDIGGIREGTRDLSARLATRGYVVLLPNVFYRTTKPPVFRSPPNFGDEATRKRFGELTAPLAPDAVERDGAAYLDYLDSQPGVRSGKYGVVGYCFTGSHAMRYAASQSERIVSAASFHGGGLYTDKPESPHLLLPRIRARLYFGHAVEDRSMPKEAIDKLDQALAAWGGSYENEVYEGARHGWTMPGRVHHPAQAERAFTKLTELFDTTLR